MECTLKCRRMAPQLQAPQGALLFLARLLPRPGASYAERYGALRGAQLVTDQPDVHLIVHSGQHSGGTAEVMQAQARRAALLARPRVCFTSVPGWVRCRHRCCACAPGLDGNTYTGSRILDASRETKERSRAPQSSAVIRLMWAGGLGPRA